MNSQLRTQAIETSDDQLEHSVVYSILYRNSYMSRGAFL